MIPTVSSGRAAKVMYSVSEKKLMKPRSKNEKYAMVYGITMKMLSTESEPSRENTVSALIGCLHSAAPTSDHLPPPASMLSRRTVASTEAACSEPISATRAFGQVNRKRGE